MNDHIIFKGVNSLTLGIIATEIPEIILPEERVTFTDVPGRSGSLTQTEGEDVFNDLTFPVEFFYPDPTQAGKDAIAAHFRGAGKLILPTRTGGYYEARVVNQIPLQKVLRGSASRDFTVNFRLKPLFRLDIGDVKSEIESGDSLDNPGGVIAKPTIEITGSGDITLLVGDQIVTLTDVEDGIILDGELQEAYYDGELLNGKMTGAFPVLGAGTTAISWTGGSVSKVEITPHWVMR